MSYVAIAKRLPSAYRTGQASRQAEGFSSPKRFSRGFTAIVSHRLGITVVKSYSELPLVECYASQLNQVFMNVLSNAIDALEEFDANRTLQETESSPSQITISTTAQKLGISAIDGDISIPQENHESSPILPSCEEHIIVQIKDNGLGMSESIQSQIFDPFFTTKPLGKGTGLGLSISYQIIGERHKGQLKCISTPGEGTAFLIKIPVRQQV